ncbi:MULTISPECIES: DUF4832 domain-containing protein [unclassified Chamaesiphon]|uniref:DUF4832 domain-containing protein n=1 Tax=unclassified Chamaesiphon TaxID=2620921 RepID=UPI00286C0AF4|nr:MULTISPECIES: DUF4832 domain-containing protein [unclassified Chamaesiphon]
MNRYSAYLFAIGYISTILVGCMQPHDSVKIAGSTQDDRDVPAVASLILTANKPSVSPKSIVTYPSTTAEFPNPERGFHDNIELMSGRDFNNTRRNGYSLSRAYIRLDEYRNRPLPPEFLAQLNRQLQLVRSAGTKVILRFGYNFPNDGDDIEKAPDASLDLTISHINQLKPILQQNADVIAVMQAGFIGAWGEWHGSGNGLARPQPKAKILAALLAATPASRMVQLRYPNDIRNNYPQPLTLAAAFRGNRQARVGFHNDCFLSNQSDAGTYKPDIPALANYANKFTPFVAVGGETCQVTLNEHRSDCPTAEADLARFHWSYLNSSFYKPDLDRWRQAGCYGKIARKLGYRLQLVRSNFTSQVANNRQLNGNFTIANTGYASPFNPRGLEVVMRHQSTGKIYRLPILKSLSKTHDPRFWLASAGEISVDVRAKIPPTAPLGTYELLLNLPDPMPKLKNRPEYSIRLANAQTWEAKTGFNSLRRTVQLIK